MAEADRDRKPLSDQDSRAPLPLAQVEDLEELKAYLNALEGGEKDA